MRIFAPGPVQRKRRRLHIKPTFPIQQVLTEREVEYTCTGCEWKGPTSDADFAVAVHLEKKPYHVIVKTERRKTIIERNITKEVHGA